MRWFLIIIAALGVGVYSALWMAGLAGGKPPVSFSDIEVGGWYGDRSIGDKSANPYTRARVARHGLLALNRSEAIYFIRARDDEGNPLLEECTYELSGEGQDAFWWSITLYTESRLPMNNDLAMSVDATSLGNGPWRVTISPQQPSDRAIWLSSSKAGTFDLLLRLYRPSKDVLSKPEANVNPPNIRKLRCSSEHV